MVHVAEVAADVEGRTPSIGSMPVLTKLSPVVDRPDAVGVSTSVVALLDAVMNAGMISPCGIGIWGFSCGLTSHALHTPDCHEVTEGAGVCTDIGESPTTTESGLRVGPVLEEDDDVLLAGIATDTTTGLRTSTAAIADMVRVGSATTAMTAAGCAAASDATGAIAPAAGSLEATSLTRLAEVRAALDGRVDRAPAVPAELAGDARFNRNPGAIEDDDESTIGSAADALWVPTAGPREGEAGFEATSPDNPLGSAFGKKIGVDCVRGTAAGSGLMFMCTICTYLGTLRMVLRLVSEEELSGVAPSPTGTYSYSTVTSTSVRELVRYMGWLVTCSASTRQNTGIFSTSSWKLVATMIWEILQ